MTGLSIGKVRKTLKDLEARGLICINHRNFHCGGQQSSTFTLLVSAEADDLAAEVHARTPLQLRTA
jgi:hypothetical protein